MLGFANKLLFSVTIVVCCLLLSVGQILAGSVGQIKGKVTDKDSKEPIIGASVLIVGSKMGATTDPEGNYMISRVDPGVYKLQISAVGYTKVEVNEVEVTADLTKEVNVTLSQSVANLDKVITVIASKDIIDKFNTQSAQTITAQTIKTRPVQTVDNLLRQVAGVQTSQTGEVYIRGGRAGEVAYVLDGVPIGDPLGGIGRTGANLSLVSGSIQEVQIIKDGFDPEYGNALSGIVKVSTQTGNKDNTRVNMQFLTDDLGSRKLNKYSQNDDYARFSISGPDPLIGDKILPAMGLKFLEGKEFTYFLYGEVAKNDGAYPYDRYNSPITQANYGGFDLLGITVPNRMNNRYYWMANFKFLPRQNLKFVFSYKNSSEHNTVFDWNYRYSPFTAPIMTNNWQSLSLEVSQVISKNMSYEALLSYYEQHVTQKPGDPNHPGQGLDPNQFLLESQWEGYQDVNKNGKYDPPEPILNLFPDSTRYGDGYSGPGYTSRDNPLDTVIQTGTISTTGFRFNRDGVNDNLEGEPFLDLNGNGVWDKGDYLNDKNGNGKLDADRTSPIHTPTAEPFTDGDSVIGEPFTDLNGNGVYDDGIDIFIRSADPSINQDINHNGQHDGPENTGIGLDKNGRPKNPWTLGIPFLDRNGNGIYDAPNGVYDIGEPFVDVNGNGIRDDGGTNQFLNPGTYDADILWHDHTTKTIRGEIKVTRQLGAHELKLGSAIDHDDFNFQEIKRSYISYVNRPDGGPFPDRGAFRDVFDYQPWNGTVYVRDKVEYGSMIAMLGLRWDFFLQDVNPLVAVVKSDDLGSGTILGDRQALSPRIGFSYPISDKAKVYFNYGHFYQQPSYRYMYARNTVNVDQNDVVGNYNLNYMKTVQYSFGVKYAMTETYSVDLQGYFKDEFDKINQQSVVLFRRRVNQYRNVDYGRSRGFELTLEKRGGGYIQGQVSYTYAFAYGKASQTAENYLTDFQLSRAPLTEAALDNDIRHSFKAGIQVNIPGDAKPRLFGVPIPNDWIMAIESVIESGRPFTPSKNFPLFTSTQTEDPETNSMRLPGTAVFDVRLTKNLKTAGISYSVILWIQNLFNARNVTGVYAISGRPDANPSASDMSAVRPWVPAGTAYDVNVTNWDYGRQVRIGLEINL